MMNLAAIQDKLEMAMLGDKKIAGINSLLKKKVGNETDPDDFVQKNTGPGKLYPLGPTNLN